MAEIIIEQTPSKVKTIKNITGQKFGRLTPTGNTKYVIYKGGGRRVLLRECLCECGKSCYVITQRLLGGNTKSCGCLKREQTIQRNTKHGYAKSKEHDCWVRLNQRCKNPNNKAYANYGGRGIKVSDRWQGKFGFINFLSDMGPCHNKAYSIERIDVNGDYEPANCKWASDIEQSRNHRIRKDNVTGMSGVYFLGAGKRVRRWQACISDGNKTIYLGIFLTREEAIAARQEAEARYWGRLSKNLCQGVQINSNA